MKERAWGAIIRIRDDTSSGKDTPGRVGLGESIYGQGRAEKRRIYN